MAQFLVNIDLAGNEIQNFLVHIAQGHYPYPWNLAQPFDVLPPLAPETYFGHSNVIVGA